MEVIVRCEAEARDRTIQRDTDGRFVKATNRASVENDVGAPVDTITFRHCIACTRNRFVSRKLSDLAGRGERQLNVNSSCIMDPSLTECRSLQMNENCVARLRNKGPRFLSRFRANVPAPLSAAIHISIAIGPSRTFVDRGDTFSHTYVLPSARRAQFESA